MMERYNCIRNFKRLIFMQYFKYNMLFSISKEITYENN
jgi:hypothetical protein